MNKQNRKILACFLVVLAALFVFSCKDEFGSDLPKSGLFRPQFTEVQTGGDWIYLKWDKYEPAENFQIELSVDTFLTIIKDVTIEDNSYTFNELDFDTEYWVRIKSFGANLESKLYVNPTSIKTLDVPTNLLPIQAVTSSEVRVGWTDVAYDSLVIVTKVGTLTQRIKTVKNLDNESKTIDISGLSPETDYMVWAYSKGIYQGKQKFKTTKAMVIYNDNIIDLRDPNVYPDLADIDKLNKALADFSASALQTTIILKGGIEYYYTERIMLTAALSIVAERSLNGNAIIRRSQQFDCINPGFIGGNMRFVRVSFLNHPNLAILGKGTYLFAAPRMTVDTISFESCEIRYSRGTFNANEGFNVKMLSYNNCIIDSITDMPFVRNKDGADPNRGKVEEFSITNSTLVNVTRGINSNDAVNGTKKVTIRNVTWLNLPKGRTILNFQKETTIESFVVENCIFAGAWDPDLTLPATPVRGVNAGTAAPIFKNNFITKDIIWEVEPIESTLLDLTVTDLIEDLNNRNYTLKSKSFVPGAGDPNWWPK